MMNTFIAKELKKKMKGSFWQVIYIAKIKDKELSHSIRNSTDNIPHQLRNLTATTEFVALLFPLRDSFFDVPHLLASDEVLRSLYLPIPSTSMYSSKRLTLMPKTWEETKDNIEIKNTEAQNIPLIFSIGLLDFLDY